MSAADDFDIDALDTADTAEMTVLGPSGALTNWVWIFAGPSHEKTIAQGNRLARERLHEEGQKEQARVNGKKWKAPEESVDQVRAKNIEFVVERVVGWRGASRGGKPFEFSPANVREVLSDRKKGALLVQSLEFLGGDSSFTQSSATGSSHSPSDPSN